MFPNLPREPCSCADLPKLSTSLRQSRACRGSSFTRRLASPNVIKPCDDQRKALGVVYGEEETDWFQLEMWNRDAEFAAKVCKKGGRVGVTVRRFCLLLRTDLFVMVVVVVLSLLLLLFLFCLSLPVSSWPLAMTAPVVVPRL